MLEVISRLRLLRKKFLSQKKLFRRIVTQMRNGKTVMTRWKMKINPKNQKKSSRKFGMIKPHPCKRMKSSNTMDQLTRCCTGAKLNGLV